MVITDLITRGNFFIGLVLVLGTLINIYYYLNIFFNLALRSFYSGRSFVLKEIKESGVMAVLRFFVFRFMALGIAYLFIYAMVLFNKS